MSVSYLFFTELKIDGIWHCISRTAWKFEPIKHRTLIPTYVCQSRIAFENAYGKLREESYSVKVEELSEELQAELLSNDLSEEGLTFAINIVDIDSCIGSNEVEFSGFALRSEVRDYEKGYESDIYDYISVDEYKKMDDELKKAYQYYEWNDRHGWYDKFIAIRNEVNAQLGEVAYANFSHYPRENVRVILFTE